jgi:hypothetical protein
MSLILSIKQVVAETGFGAFMGLSVGSGFGYLMHYDMKLAAGYYEKARQDFTGNYD